MRQMETGTETIRPLMRKQYFAMSRFQKTGSKLSLRLIKELLMGEWRCSYAPFLSPALNGTEWPTASKFYPR
jgi:hypothetical protein